MNTPTDAVIILSLPAFNDNYIWILRCGQHVAVVDPGDAGPVIDYLTATKGQLDAILVTHHHGDHVGGIAKLLGYTSAAHPVEVYGPATENIAQLSHRLADNDTVRLAALGVELSVFAVPGHTAGHIAYYGRNLGLHGSLFCGDTLFGAGCGRLFEGTPTQMHDSLARLAALPPLTLAYCAHEYTEANLRFALAVEPNNPDIQARAATVAQARSIGRASVPFTIETERATNPFLRYDAAGVIAAATSRLGRAPVDAIETFAAIRGWKNEFR